MWYTENEMVSWLKKNKYSETIARELAPMITKNYNSAYKKGLETKNHELEQKLKEQEVLLEACKAEKEKLVAFHKQDAMVYRLENERLEDETNRVEKELRVLTEKIKELLLFTEERGCVVNGFRVNEIILGLRKELESGKQK